MRRTEGPPRTEASGAKGPWCSIEASSRTRRARGRRRGRSASSGATIERAEGLRSVVASERNAVASRPGARLSWLPKFYLEKQRRSVAEPRLAHARETSPHGCPNLVWRKSGAALGSHGWLTPGRRALMVTQKLCGESQAKGPDPKGACSHLAAASRRSTWATMSSSAQAVAWAHVGCATRKRAILMARGGHAYGAPS
jgi:hypothetical protein